MSSSSCRNVETDGTAEKLEQVEAAPEIQEVPLPPEARRPTGPRPRPPTGYRVPAPRAVVWWLLGEPEERTEEERAFLQRLQEGSPPITTAQALVREFFRLVRERQAPGLTDWLQQVAESGIGELQRFGAGLRRDWEAVVAALTLPWSNGPTEGNIHRLKLIKRQMHGRAGFELLRARVLPARSTFPARLASSRGPPEHHQECGRAIIGPPLTGLAGWRGTTCGCDPQ